MMTFRHLMLVHRTRLDITQHQLAKLTGISRVAISRYEMGHNEPRLSHAVIIAEVLRFSLNDLKSNERIAQAAKTIYEQKQELMKGKPVNQPPVQIPAN